MDIRRACRGAAAIALLAGGPALADEGVPFEGELKDAWMTGKVETVLMLNTQLNAFDIDTSVDDGAVSLDGAVESEVDRELAAELARGVDGVTSVENRLEVATAARAADDPPPAGGGSGFRDWVADVTTTAAIKSQLVANGRLDPLAIDVDTTGDVVTLTGRVQTAEQSRLAERIAAGTRDVGEVRNELIVGASGADRRGPEAGADEASTH